MVDFKLTTWEIEDLKYSHPYVAKVDFHILSSDVDQLHYLTESEYSFKRMGKEFYFETSEERERFVNRVTAR